MSKPPKTSPNPHDILVGARLREARTLAGMSQTVLGQAVGITFQQIQKYEKGLNRIGASRLMQFSNILNVTPSFFFEDIKGNSPLGPVDSSDQNETRFDYGDASRRQALELVRYFGRIPSADLRATIFELVKTAAKNLQPGTGTAPTAEA
ncbi:helix-turn-helix transcriptional regulator [Ferrovibrio sp. MS7]|uniref:helix-turn-helix domain-containing protein n=1 Tax=Ferrovibrio plantarum TaxID=3119164 RepID=UPI0031366CC8